MKSDVCLGENGYTGKSSVVPGEPMAYCGLEASKGNAFVPPNTQTRQVSAQPLATRTGPGAMAKWK